MKTCILIVCFFSISVLSKAQGFESFYEHSTDVHLIKSDPGYVSLGFQFASGNVGKFKLSIEYTSLLVPDVAIISTLNTLTGEHPDKSPFTNFWGSLAVGVNVISTDKMVVSAGINITDYMFNDKVTPSSHAFYTGGSYARIDYLINDKLMLRARNYISISFANGSQILDMSNSIDGLNPLFVRTGVEVIYTKRFVAGIEFINVHNYPGVSAERFNIRLGYRAW